jgi:crossover junction endodeoxyribonuclease RuvC
MGWIGVDPGLSGAIAWIRDDGSVEIVDYPGEPWEIMKALKGARGETAVLEKINLRPDDVRSLSRAGKMMATHERLRTCLILSHVKLVEMRPQHWRKAAGYEGGSDKSMAVTYAIKLYPDARSQLYYKSRNGRYAEKTDRAEALLMAHAAKLIATEVESLF